MNLLSNWKFLMVCYVILFGVWGFLLKIVSSRLDWKVALFYVWITVFVTMMIFCFRSMDFGWSRYHLLAVFAGIIAAFGTMAFYKALTLAPATLIIPVSAQYILVTVVLCVIFLREPISLRIIAGIACSISAILLLSK